MAGFEQDQFLTVLDRDTAERRWWDAMRPTPLGTEEVRLADALGRVLAEDVFAAVDVPGFDRSNVDGFALRAEEALGATEEAPRGFRLNGEVLATGVVPRGAVAPGTATAIATGGMLPRGADAVVMVEQTHIRAGTLWVTRPVAPGAGVSFAGTDLARGECALRAGSVLSSRETGVLAAIGRGGALVVRRPRVAILSTGDELVAPGGDLPLGAIYDSNGTILADAVREAGGEPLGLGIVGDNEAALRRALGDALAASDLVLLSGGTSKGAGDLSYRVLESMAPGIVVHGVALKPGKPICLGGSGSVPIAILPGFPTSAVFTFHEFVAPMVRHLAGRRSDERRDLAATFPQRVNSERGRTEYVLVNLVPGPDGLLAFPMGKGSGSVTAFSRADGFVTIPKHQEFLEAGAAVRVTPIGPGHELADLMVIGSHCTGLEAVLGLLERAGLRTKALWVGSQGGVAAVARGACDVAGLHLLDPATREYNRPFLPPGTRLLPGYGRMQCVVFRRGDARFEGLAPHEAVARALADPDCAMVNRNRGSGTRVLIDDLLGSVRPIGWAVEARSHSAVAASVAQGRSDWGVAIEPAARTYGLGSLPLGAERYDFAVPESRWDRPAVRAFRDALNGPTARARLAELGFLVEGPTA